MHWTDPWGTANLGEEMELVVVHDTRQAKVSYHDVGILFLCPEDQVLGLEICVA